MKFEDKVAPLRGEFDIHILRNGKEIEHFSDHNLIVDGAREILAILLGSGDADKVITYVAVGTNSTEADISDTAITDEYRTKVLSVTYPSAGRVAFSFNIGTSEANGMEITEFGLLCSDGTLFARKVRGVISKDDDISIVGTWTIIF